MSEGAIKGGITMTKDEILKMSREENKNMDEREQGIILRGADIAKTVGLALCMIVVFLSDILGADPAAGLGAFAIYWGMNGTDYAYRAWHLHKRKNIIIAVCSFAFCISFVVAYLCAVLGKG